MGTLKLVRPAFSTNVSEPVTWWPQAAPVDTKVGAGLVGPRYLLAA